VKIVTAEHVAESADLGSFGGHLECLTCHHTEPLAASRYLLVGWPRCCGYTMRWWTARQVAAAENVQ
jgi:hypothetical protein